MSFILDALKKSEVERQRQATPGLMEAHVARRARGFPLWAMALVVLLAVNLVVLLFVLTRGGRPAAPAPQTLATAAPPRASAAPAVRAPSAEATSAAASQNAAVAEHFSPLDAPPEYAPEIPPSDISASAAGSTAAPRGGLAPPRAQAPAHEPQMSEADLKAENEVLPSINDINLSESKLPELHLDVPELHLDVHVYATRPADRFVYVNNRRYHEGMTLAEGPQVERIRRDGVILNFGGVRFLLPRQ
jgi:general secretion pathway protein B